MMKLLALFVGVALLAAACGVIGDETPTPTRDVPTLSSEAAIGLVSNNCRNPRLANGIRKEARAVYRGNGVWVVDYEYPSGTYTRWEVYEPSGVVAPIGDSAIHVYCQREPAE